MKRIVINTLIAGLAVCQVAVCTVVSDRLPSAANGQYSNGRIVVSWPTFVSLDGVEVPQGQIAVPVTNGVISVTLLPYAGYTASYFVTSPSGRLPVIPSVEYWTVPDSATPVTINTIRTTTIFVPPTTIALAQIPQAGALNGECLMWFTSSGSWSPQPCALGNTGDWAGTWQSFNIGTSGGSIPLLSGLNTWNLLQTLSGGLALPNVTGTQCLHVVAGVVGGTGVDCNVDVGGGTVTSVFARTGDVVAGTGDYTAAQVTNAVSTIGTYANPAWLTAFSWAGLTGVPSTFAPINTGNWAGAWQTHAPAYFQTALSNYSTISGLSGYPSTFPPTNSGDWAGTFQSHAPGYFQTALSNYSTISGLSGYPSTFPPTNSGDWAGTFQTHTPAYFQTALVNYSTISGLSGYPSTFAPINSGDWAGTFQTHAPAYFQTAISGAPGTWPSFGTAALVNTGTSGTTVPLTNGAITWSGAHIFSAGLSGALAGNATTATNLAAYPAPCAGTQFSTGYTAGSPPTNNCATPAGAGNVSNTGTPLIHQLGVWATATTVGGIAVGTTDAPLVGVTSGDPAFSKLTLTNPATAATLTIADGKTVVVNNSITLAGTDSTTMTFPSTSATIARTDAANTFIGVQTMTSPTIISGAFSTTGNAATSTAFASTPGLCSIGNAPVGIDVNGNATGCAPNGAGGGGANASGYYLVNQSTSAPANAINLGALTTGFLLGTVSGGVSTISKVGSSGTGSVCLNINCVLTTPNIGGATGTSLSVTGNVTAAGNLYSGSGSGTDGAIHVASGAAGIYDFVLNGSASSTASAALWLPPADGTSGQAITTDGSGHLGFATISGGVSSVFARTGAVTAQTGDYTAAQVTNAVSTIGTYANPAWLTAFPWAGLTGVPSTFAPTLSGTNTWTSPQTFSGGLSSTGLATAKTWQWSAPMTFANATSQLVGYIDFGNVALTGDVEVEVTGSYDYSDATGVLKKDLQLYRASSSAIGEQFSRIVQADGNTAAEFAVGDFIVDGGNHLKLPIYDITSNGDTAYVSVKGVFSAVPVNPSVITPVVVANAQGVQVVVNTGDWAGTFQTHAPSYFQTALSNYSTISGLSGYPSAFPPTNTGNWAGNWQTFSPGYFQTAITNYSTISGLTGYPATFPPASSATPANGNVLFFDSGTGLWDPGVAVTPTTLGNASLVASLVSLSTTGAVIAGGAVTATGNVTANSGSSAAGCIHLSDASNVHDMGLCAPSSGSNLLPTLPSADGTAGQLLKTDGAGHWGWITGSGSVTLDAVLPPVASATDTFPATDTWTITGTAPASSATNGTNAGTLLSVTGATGGATTSLGTNTAGAGGPLHFAGGKGGSATAAGTTLTVAGVGGGVTATGGNGGDGLLGNDTGANGGPVVVTTGGGGLSYGTAANTNGGQFLVNTGPPGTGGSGAAGVVGQITFEQNSVPVANWNPTGNLVLNGYLAQGTTTMIGGRDISLNAALGTAIVRGANQIGTGGAASYGGQVLIEGGGNFATSLSSSAGNVQILTGASTATSITTAGTQGLLLTTESYLQGTSVTQWTLQCWSTAAFTVSTCGASPDTWIGVAELKVASFIPTVQVAISPSQIPINASSAVTLGHTVCAGASAGQVTDSGGVNLCTTAQGHTVGTAISVTGHTYTYPDGTTFTVSSTYPLIQLLDASAAGGGGGGAVSSVFTRTGAVTAQAGDYTAAQVTNAVSTIGTYASPAWLTAFSWAGLTGVPSTFAPINTGNWAGAWQTFSPSYFQTALSLTTMGTGVATLSGGALNIPVGGGAVMAAQLGDLAVVRTSSGMLTIGSGCSSSTPCNVSGHAIITPATVTVSGAITGTPTGFIWVDNSGAINVGYNNLTTVVCSGCTATSGITSFPPGNVTNIWTWTASTASTGWDSTGGVDKRSFLSTKALANGGGVNITDTPGLSTLMVDSAYVQGIIPTLYTVATLPSCVSGIKGQEKVVTNAITPTYLGTLTGGGAVVTPVICNGTAWVSY